MEVAVAAIAVIAVCCGKSVCFSEGSSSPRKSKAHKSRELDEMRDYLEYMLLEEQTPKAALGHRYHH